MLSFEFYSNIPITIKTLWYSLLWLAMMIIGGTCYEQRFYSKKHNGKKMQTLALAGWLIIIVATLGLVHGVLAFFHLILPIGGA